MEGTEREPRISNASARVLPAPYPSSPIPTGRHGPQWGLLSLIHTISGRPQSGYLFWREIEKRICSQAHRSSWKLIPARQLGHSQHWQLSPNPIPQTLSKEMFPRVRGKLDNHLQNPWGKSIQHLPAGFLLRAWTPLWGWEVSWVGRGWGRENRCCSPRHNSTYW